MTRKTPILAAALTTLVAFGALAQEQFSETKLEALALAANELTTIRQAAAERIEAIDDPARQQEIMAEANAMMVEAVEKAPGITVDEYNEIVVAANQDPDFAERLGALLSAK